MRYAIVFLGLTAWFGMGQCADAALILQDQTNSASQVQAFEPIGQVFTAEDVNIESIGLYIREFNSSETNRNVSVYLRPGAGTGGPILYAHTVVPAPGTNGWVDFFTGMGVELVVGSQYTIQIDAFSPRWGVDELQHTFGGGGGPIPGFTNYVGGDAMFNGALNPIRDLRFRVVPVAAPASVPEPTTLTMFGLGALGFVGAGVRRRFRRTA